MGIGIVLIFWIAVAGVVGLFVGLISSAVTKNTKTGVGSGCAIFLLIPILFIGAFAYQNRSLSPNGHWLDEFEEDPPAGFELIDADSTFSTDFYGRMIWLKSTTRDLEKFAASKGFIPNKKTEKNDGTPKNKIIGWGGKTLFSPACTYVIRYSNDSYFGYNHNNNNKPDAWIRHCPETGESQILIVDVD